MFCSTEDDTCTLTPVDTPVDTCKHIHTLNHARTHLEVLRCLRVVDGNAFREDDKWVSNPQVRQVLRKTVIDT